MQKYSAGLFLNKTQANLMRQSRKYNIFCLFPLYLEELGPLGIGILDDLGQHLDSRCLEGPVGQGREDLPVRETVCGVGPEGELRPENCLSLQPCALPDEQMVVVALKLKG